MTMNLTRPIIFLDIESATANPHRPDPQYDRIIEIAALKFIQADPLVDAWHDKPISFVGRYNPGIPIAKENAAIHGFTDEIVQKYEPFSARAKEWHAFIGNADLAGFGIRRYDLPLLVTEFERCGLSFCWRSRLIVDAGMIFKLKEERTLTAAAKFYCQREHEGAHAAMADVRMTVDVFRAQLQRYDDLGQMDLAALHKFSQYEDEALTLDGKIAKGPDGDPIYTFGSNTRGVKVKDDLGFARWILSKDFPRDTHEWLEAYMQSLRTTRTKDESRHERDDDL